AEEQSYENRYGKTVSWKFVGISDLEYIQDNSLESGTEIKSRLFKSKIPSRNVQSKDQLTIFRWQAEAQARNKDNTRLSAKEELPPA
ncbi:MAG: DUF4288 domain-containing protein, partial [Chloroflexia bacterium]